MRRLFAIILLLLYCSSVVSARDTIIYSAHPGLAQGEQLGLGSEIVKKIFLDMDVAVKSETFPWPRVLEMARQGRIDVIAGLYFTDERAQFLVFSDFAYTESRVVLITRKGYEFPYEKWSDLKGRRGGSILGDSWGVEFDRYIEEHLDIESVYSFNQNYLKLLNGRIDYVILSDHNPGLLAKQRDSSNQITIYPVPVSSEKAYVAFSKYSPLLKYFPEFNDRLRQMLESGEIEELAKKYLVINAQ